MTTNLDRFLEACGVASLIGNKTTMALTDDIKFIIDIIPIEDTANIELHFYNHTITLNTFALDLNELSDKEEMTKIYNMAKLEIKQYAKLISTLVKEL